MYTQAVIDGLSWLRNGWDGDNSEKAIEAFEALDNAGVFQEIDEQTGYDVDGGRSATHGTPVDPAEWGDTTGEDMARHQMDAGDREAMSRLGRRAFGIKD